MPRHSEGASFPIRTTNRIIPAHNDEMTKGHLVERALSFVLGDGKTKPEAKCGPSAKKPPSSPSKFGRTPLPLKPAAVLGFGVCGLPSVAEEPRSVAVGVVAHRRSRPGPERAGPCDMSLGGSAGRRDDDVAVAHFDLKIRWLTHAILRWLPQPFLAHGERS
jgi:hypothetical protein